MARGPAPSIRPPCFIAFVDGRKIGFATPTMNGDPGFASAGAVAH
jgi:hypothetical protein